MYYKEIVINVNDDCIEYPCIKSINDVNISILVTPNGDFKNELLLVGEWMPISVFHMENGIFVKKEVPSLNKTNGWWNTIEVADIDLDGDVDFVLGNLGENYKFKASEDKPFYVFASDYDKNGTNDVFLAKNYKDKNLLSR